MPKLIYIAHQVGGDVQANVQSILAICKQIHTADIIPVVPYLVALQYLRDHVSEDRELGTQANLEFLRRKLVDEVWLCGPRISEGMKAEILLAQSQQIPIHCYNSALQKELEGLNLTDRSV